MRALWEFDVILDPEDGQALNARRDKASEVEIELYPYELDLLATISIGPIDNWE
jgi:hypothetical protein